MDELEDFKTDINLTEYAATQGSDLLISLRRINDIEIRAGFVMNPKGVLKPLSYEVFVVFWGHK